MKLHHLFEESQSVNTDPTTWSKVYFLSLLGDNFKYGNHHQKKIVPGGVRRVIYIGADYRWQFLISIKQQEEEILSQMVDDDSDEVAKIKAKLKKRVKNNPKNDDIEIVYMEPQALKRGVSVEIELRTISSLYHEETFDATAKNYAKHLDDGGLFVELK